MTTPKPDPPDTFAVDCASIHSVSRALLTLSDALLTTGNVLLANRLEGLAADLDGAIRRIEARDFDISRERTRDAIHASSNLLNGVLAGITIGQRDKAVKEETP